MGDSKRVVICGAGAIGSSIAYFLSKKIAGSNITVVEKCGVACAASGKAGGFLALDWCDNSVVGPLARQSFALHAQINKELNKDTGFRLLDTLSVSAHVGKAQKKAIPSMPTWLDKNIIGGSTIMGSTKTTAQVYPPAYTNSVLDAAKTAGAQVVIGTVEDVKIEEGKVVGVQVDGKIVEADTVVIAMGPWSFQATKWFPTLPEVSGHKAHSIVLHPRDPVTAHAIFLEYKSAEGSFSDPEIYPRPDGDVYVCGMSDGSSLPEDPATIQPTKGSCEALVGVAHSLSTSLEGAELRKSQACFLPISPDGTPIIGKISGVEGAYVATGHSCWGILNAPATGAAMAELIADGKSSIVDLTPFDPSRFVQAQPKKTKKMKG